MTAHFFQSLSLTIPMESVCEQWNFATSECFCLSSSHALLRDVKLPSRFKLWRNLSAFSINFNTLDVRDTRNVSLAIQWSSVGLVKILTLCHSRSRWSICVAYLLRFEKKKESKRNIRNGENNHLRQVLCRWQYGEVIGRSCLLCSFEQCFAATVNFLDKFLAPIQIHFYSEATCSV